MTKGLLTINIDNDIINILRTHHKGKISEIINNLLLNYLNAEDKETNIDILKKELEKIEEKNKEFTSKKTEILLKIQNIESKKQIFKKQNYEKLKQEYFNLDQDIKDDINFYANSKNITPVEYYIEYYREKLQGEEK